MNLIDAKPKRERRDRPDFRPAVGLALAFEAFALSRSTDLWMQLARTTTVAALLASLVAMRYGSERRRAACRGFALFGWIYLLLSLGAFGIDPRSFFLATTSLFDIIVPYVEPKNLALIDLQQFRQYFNQIGHSLFALLFGIAGAKLATFMVDRNQEDSADQDHSTHDSHATLNP